MPVRSLLPFLLLPLFVRAQPFRFEVDNTVPVSVDGRALPNAWAGGLNAGQFSTLHLDADSVPDLVVFDRTDGKLTAFVAKSVDGRYAYRHAPVYEPLFPDLRFWLLLADYDRDGRKDAFTHTNLGIKVYRNVTEKGGALKWALAREALYTQGYRDTINLQVGAGDIPALVDVDNDGDLDILAYDQVGSYVEYHQNQSVERYGHARALEFRRINACWGNFGEGTECGDFDFNVDCQATGRQGNEGREGKVEYPTRNSDFRSKRTTPSFDWLAAVGGCRAIRYSPSLTFDLGLGGTPHSAFIRSTFPSLPTLPDDRLRVQHAGSTLLALDLDGDRDQDILVGDVSCPDIFRMINRGTPQRAVFRDFGTDFPADRPIRFPTFPATYYEDLDFDGVKDLVAAPNVFVNEGGLVDFGRSAWLYHNRGSDSVPDFSFRQPDFLQNTMVDLGEATAPALADYDADGDLDLFVGNGGVPGKDRPVATVWLFENTGTATTPAFALRTKDYLQLSSRQLTRIRPGFADLNGDGKLDFWLVANQGSLARMRIIFNVGSRKGPFRFRPNRALTLSLSLETNDVPSLADLDGDGDVDLLVGKAGGNLEAYQNVGDGKKPDFQPENRALGGLEPDAAGRNAAPAVADLDGDGKPDLLVGNRTGKLRIYPDFTSNLIEFNGPVTNWVRSSLPGPETELGGLLHPTTGDLNGDGQPDILLGTNAGGLIYLRNIRRK